MNNILLIDGFLFVCFTYPCILFLSIIIIPVKVEILRSCLIKFPGLLGRLVRLRPSVERIVERTNAACHVNNSGKWIWIITSTSRL